MKKLAKQKMHFGLLENWNYKFLFIFFIATSSLILFHGFTGMSVFDTDLCNPFVGKLDERLVIDLNSSNITFGLFEDCKTKQALGELQIFYTYDSLSTVKNRTSLDDLPEFFEFLKEYSAELPLNDKKIIIQDAFSIVRVTNMTRRVLGFRPGITANDVDFLVQVGHSLWVEYNGVVPWSISNYTTDQIDKLFTYSDTFSEDVDHIEKESWKTYNVVYDTVDLSMGSTQLSVLSDIVKWHEVNFFHLDEPESSFTSLFPHTNIWTFNKYNTRTPDIETLFSNRISDCHLSSAALIAMARALNIPGKEYHTRTHGAAYFPTLNKYVHGDLPAVLSALQPHEILMTKEELDKFEASWNKGSFASFMLNWYKKTGVFLSRSNDSLFIHVKITDPEYKDEGKINNLSKLIKQYGPNFYRDENDNILANTSNVKIRSLY